MKNAKTVQPAKLIFSRVRVDIGNASWLKVDRLILRMPDYISNMTKTHFLVRFRNISIILNPIEFLSWLQNCEASR